MTTTPPGWYDQQPGPVSRWWDGSGWTAYIRVDSVPPERRHRFATGQVGAGWLRLSTVLLALLTCCGLLVLASLVWAGWLYGEVRSWKIDPPSDASLDRIDEIDLLLSALRILVLLVTGVLFIVWLYLAHRSERLDASRRRHRSFWAWLGWLIPIANLFIPPALVNDVRRASQPEDRPPAGELLGAWWTCLLIGGFLNRNAASQEVDDVEGLLSMLVTTMVGDAFVLAAAVLVVLLVREIRERVRESPFGPRLELPPVGAVGPAATAS